MFRLKGGRAKKAPYRSISIWCPLPLVEEVRTLISKYRESCFLEEKSEKLSEKE